VGAMAWGMWLARYWAVLGFQASLALIMLAAALGLVRVTNGVQAIATTVILVGAGVLFYLMVKALARIQMPERRPPA
jgi:threonine/homoserine/homoserine lactone efflux protein